MPKTGRNNSEILGVLEVAGETIGIRSWFHWNPEIRVFAWVEGTSVSVIRERPQEPIYYFPRIIEETRWSIGNVKSEMQKLGNRDLVEWAIDSTFVVKFATRTTSK